MQKRKCSTHFPVGLIATILGSAVGLTPCAATEQVLDERMHHLRSGDEREWAEFPEEAEGKTWLVTFAAKPAQAPYTLRLRHRDVKQKWRLRLNDRDLGSLPTDENCMTTFWEILPAALLPGKNQLAIEGDGLPSDDIEVGDVRLIDQPRRAALRAATLNVVIADADTGQPIPSRVTVVDEYGSLITVGAESSKRLAVRPGVIYTADGKAEFGLPAGKYTVYAGRGFEYSVDAEEFEVRAGQRHDVRLAIHREAPMPGYVSCDTHVHTLTYSGHGDATLDERLVTLAGEGVELPIATDHNVQVDYRSVLEASGLSSFFTPVVGNEVTTRVGHFNVFPLDPHGPVLDFRGTSWQAVFDVIAKQGRVIVLNHPRDVHGGFRPFAPARRVSVAGEELDGWALQAGAMELVNSGALRTDPWRLVHDWFGLLNAGRRITPVGSSDSHDVARSIVGQARTYIRCRDDQPDKINVAETNDVCERAAAKATVAAIHLNTARRPHMEYRFFDLLYVLLLVLLSLTSGGLMLYAIWNIGLRLMRAMHVFLTCWDYRRACRKEDDVQRRLFVFDPVMRAILRAASPIQVFCPVFINRLRQLRRLEEYRFAKLQKAEADLVWDDRLAALLTRDEYDFLYGADAQPALP